MNQSFLLKVIALIFLIDSDKRFELPRHHLLSASVRRHGTYIIQKNLIKRGLFELLVLIGYGIYVASIDHESYLFLIGIIFLFFNQTEMRYYDYSIIFIPLFVGLLLVGNIASWIAIVIMVVVRIYQSNCRVFEVYNKSTFQIPVSIVRIFQGAVSLSLIIATYTSLTQNIPIEQFILILVMIVSNQLLGTYQDHKIFLLTCRRRFRLTTLRKKGLNLSFLSVRQQNNFLMSLVAVMILMGTLLVVSEVHLDFLILSLAILSQLLMTIDLILNHYILQKSRVYANKTTRFISESIVIYLVFVFLIYYSASKYVGSIEEIAFLSGPMRLFFGVFFSLLNLFYMRRWYGSHVL